MVDAKKFWDKMAPGYAKSPIRNMDAYEQTLERVRTYLADTDSVLEMGCGTGTTALRLAPFVSHITASDLSPEMISIAERKGREQGAENVSFVCKTAEQDATDAAVHDAVLAFNLLHLVEDLPLALRQMREHLKPGGFFISKTTCLAENGWHFRILIAAMRLIGKAPFVGILRQDQLRGLVEDAGFEIVESCVFKGARRSRFIVARKT